MDNIPDQGDEELNQILREILAQPKVARPQRTQTHGPGRAFPQGFACPTQDSASCVPLIADAAATLMDKARWPGHVCREVARAANQRWLQETVPWVSESLLLPDFEQPVVPIGRRSMAKWVGEHLGGVRKKNVEAIPNMMPLPGDEYAALILVMRCPAATITMFGMVIDTQDEDSYRIGPAYFHCFGSRPDEKSVLHLTKNARVWWSRFAGASANDIRCGGRPRGSSKLRSIADVRSWLDEYREESSDEFKSIRKNDFVDYIAPRVGGLCVDTLDNFLRSEGTTWLQFLSE